MNAVYVVDDDRSVCASLKSILVKESYSVETADSPEKFLAAVETNPPAVAVLDIFFGNGKIDGEELIRIMGERFPNTQCIVISGESDVQKALACLRLGALDFLDKPVSLPRLITAVRNAMDLYNIKTSARDKSRILGDSRITQNIIGKVKKLAGLSENVLITGESGTGKELIARNLHLFSKRYSLPMVTVNCSALNPNLLESELFGHKAGSFTGADKNKKGVFEAAERSTLFIDEIGDFPIHLQSKVLRVIQEKVITPVGCSEEIPVDVRMVFATHRNLRDMVAAGTFREDLYFRISTFTIEVPPLRDRMEDVDALAPFFLSRFLMENGLPLKELTSEALAKLKEYHYPGNIRELAKVIKNAAFFAETDCVLPGSIDFSPQAGAADIWVKTQNLSISESKEYFERELLVRRMSRANNDVKKAAESLGLIKNNLYRKLRYYSIDFKK
jgi:two-component system, NtrC family, nitrogen regulation response regulator NtrX